MNRRPPIPTAAALGGVLWAATWGVAGCDRGGTSMDHTTSGDCATCHSEQAAQWATSAHAVGASSPVFKAYVEHVQTRWGPQAAAGCTNCHAPEHSGPDQNITCISCHAAVGNRGTKDGRLIIALDEPLAGPVGALIGAPHRSRPGGFLKSPDLCGTCHEVTGPGLLDEPTWSQYAQSPAAAEGKTCADCHMPELAPGPMADGATVPRIRRDHRFQGVDPLWASLADPTVTASHWERVRALLDDALQLSVTETADGVVVRLDNVGAGHAVPTGMAAIRDIWVDVDLIDAEGRTVSTMPRVLTLGDQPMRDGQPVALFTDADVIAKRALEAGASTAVTLDEDGVGQAFATAEATLKFRSVRPEVLVALGLEALEQHVPALTIATARP